MPRFQHVISISAPPERVWDVLVDIERWPARIPTVDQAERLDSLELGLGVFVGIHNHGRLGAPASSPPPPEQETKADDRSGDERPQPPWKSAELE